MCEMLLRKNNCGFMCLYGCYATNEACGNYLSASVCETAQEYNKASCRLYIDEKFNIFLPMNGNVEIEMEPLPKSIYLLFLRHPEGILLKNISNYRVELEDIYCKVSRRKNPTVIQRLLGEVTNPASNMLHKNLSIIRASFFKKLPPEEAWLFVPQRNRSREQYVLLDVSCMKLPEILC